MADADEVLKGREIFLEKMAQVITEGYIPSEQLKRRLELMGMTTSECRIKYSHLSTTESGDGRE